MNAEHRAIMKCTVILIRGIASDLSSIANELVASELISTSNWDVTSVTGLTNEEKASRLFQIIANRIETNPKRFQDFVAILRKEKCREDTLQKLEEKYEECCETQSNRSRQSYSASIESYRGNEDWLNPSKRRHYSDSYQIRRSSSSSSSKEVWSSSEMSPDQNPPHEVPKREPSASDNEEKLDLKSASNAISDVTVNNLRNLGTQLGIESSKLDEIDSYPVEQRKSKMIGMWFEIDESPTWDKLTQALRKESVLENKAAEKACSIRRGSSLDTTYLPETPLGPTKPLITFTEATVLEAITPISNVFELGLRLEIPDNILRDIEQHPVAEWKQRLVSALFRVKPKYTWKEVNPAIHNARVAEWASRKRSNSMTKSTSLDSISQFGSYSTGSMCKEEDMSMAGTMEKHNITEIRDVYSKLMNSVIKQLKVVEPDMKEFYLHIINIFEEDNVPGCISETSDIHSIFQSLTKHKFWSFRNISQLKSIAKCFIKEDEGLKEKFKEYDIKLNGYKANTRIIDMIKSDEIKEDDADEDEDGQYESIASNPGKYTRKYRVRIRNKLFKTKDGKIPLNMKSLEYIEGVWNDLCDLFEMSLSSVLDKITVGCIEVVWLIPYSSAHLILERIHGTEEFFRKKFISNVLLEDIPIYSESCGVANRKTLQEAQLLLAVQGENLEKAQCLFKEDYHGNVNAEVTKADMTVLMIAAHNGGVDITATLLEHGAKIDAQDVHGWSALFYASNGDHIDTVKYLSDHGANITLRSKNGVTVLDLAHKCNANAVYGMLKEKVEIQLVNSAKEGEVSSVERILDMGTGHINVDATDPEKELWTSLMWASWLGHPDTVRLLLKCNPNVNVAAIKGWAPLILASRAGHCQIINDLLNHGANIDQKADGGWSSLLMAASQGKTEAGRILVQNGAKVDCIDQGGYTPLAQASQDGHSEFVEMLIKEVQDLDLNIMTKGSWTPLMLASKNGWTPAADILINNGADIDLHKDDCVNSLHIASYAGHSNIVRSMIRNKAGMDATDSHGVTALMFAVKQGHSKVAEMLLWIGKADINLQEYDAKFTAPFLAIKCKHNKMVDMFLRNDNLDLGITDLEGNTILDIAEKYNPDVVDLIREKFDKMKLTPSKKSAPPSPSPSSAAASATPERHTGKLTTKTPINYIQMMLDNMDLRMGQKPGAARAA